MFIFKFQGYPMNLEKLRAKLAYVTRPAPEHLAVRDEIHLDRSDKINKFSMNIQNWKALDELIVINIYFKINFWLAWSKIVCKCKIYFGNLMKLTVATYDVWQTCKYIVLLYLGNVYKKMKNKLAVEMFIWNSDRTNLKMQEIKPMAFGILSVTVDSYELVIGSKDKLTRWIVKILHGPNKNPTWWPVQKKNFFF